MIRRYAALAAALLPAAASAQPAPKADKLGQEDGRGGCFYINQLGDDRPLNDHSVLFRVNVSDYYQLDFAQRCYALTYPQPKLILTPVGGIGLICRALDVDVKVGEQGPGSIPEPCIPTSLHKLSPAEVSAIGKKNLP